MLLHLPEILDIKLHIPFSAEHDTSYIYLFFYVSVILLSKKTHTRPQYFDFYLFVIHFYSLLLTFTPTLTITSAHLDSNHTLIQS